MMEQNDDFKSDGNCNLLRITPSSNDLSLLDSSYQTAIEEENNPHESLSLNQTDRQVASLTQRQIKSQRLVDSDNEESTDNDDEGAEQCAELRSKLTNSTYEPMANNKYDLQRANFNRAMSEEASKEQTRINGKRSTWRQHSLMNRLQMTMAMSDDGDESGEAARQRPSQIPSCQSNAPQSDQSSVAVDDDNEAADEEATNALQRPMREYSKRNDDNSASSFDRSHLECSTKRGESCFEKHQTENESIMIRIQQYNSFSNEYKSIELSENDESVVQSIKQQNNTLNNLMSFHQKESRAAKQNLKHNNKLDENLITSIPSRSSSAIDLSNPNAGEQSSSAAAAIGDRMANGSVVFDYDGQAVKLYHEDNSARKNSTNDQAIRFTRALSPYCVSGNGGGSLSDYSNQIQSIGRILDTNAVSQRQIESKLKTWKRSNKIITNIHENPFNMHLDLLEKFEHQVSGDICPAKKEASNDKCDSSSDNEIEQQKSGGGDAVAADVIRSSNNEINNNNNQKQPKQEQLNSCALHLTHLYKRNQTVMDNNSEFRALLYNIICCLLVQDEQVLATQSVGKMLEVIRAHLDSVTRVYSTASSTNSNRSALLDSNSELESRTVGNSCCTNPLNSDIPKYQPTQKTSETKQLNNTDDKKTKIFDNVSALSPNNHRSQKPIDFRRISSVSFNDEQLINDLCDANRRELSHRSGSLSLEKTTGGNDGRDSPWAYQELSSERRRPRLDSSSTSISQQQHQLNTSQSSLDQANDATQRQQRSDTFNDSGNGTMCEYQTTTASSSSEKQQALSGSHQTVRSSEYEAHGYGRRFSGASDLMGCRQLQQVGKRFETEFKPKQQPSYISTDDYLTNNDNDCWTSTTFNGAGGEHTDGDVDEFTSSQGTTTGVAGGGNQSNGDFGQLANCNDVASRRAELEWTLNKLINLELKHTWLTSNDTLKRAIRKIGVPNEIRGKVWLILVEQLIGSKYDAKNFLAEADRTIASELEAANASDGGQAKTSGSSNDDEELQSILKQIELDINRTMPGHRLFEDGAEGGIKLRRILVAYSVHVNREIAYCQGFNFIVALLLSLFEGDEEKALRGFVCIVDHIFPSKYYFDHYLTGARADQFLLADFICDQLIKNPTMAERKMVEGVTSSITLNWFISLFHGAVPTLTRLTILDHFMLEGVKALFRFTMAILYLAFQVAPPSSCEVFTAIRNTAKDLYDIKLLLSIVDQIKLPKDSYFAIRRSFYMVQSSFNSDQFYMQTLSNDAKRNLNPNKPLNVQQLPDTKPPALSFITNASPLNQHLSPAHASSSIGFNNNNNHDHSAYNNFTIRNSICTDSMNGNSPRIRTSANRTKVCIQSLGKLGRSHIKIIDANVKTNERSLMSPLRNCIVIGISNCGKNLIVARQSSRRSFKSFREQDLTFHIHEICTEIFDGFYLEEANLALIVTHQGEVFKIDTTRCFTDNQDGSTETLMLRDSHSIVEHERVKLRLASLDELTNLLWIYVECEDTHPVVKKLQKGSNVKCSWNFSDNPASDQQQQQASNTLSSINVGPKPKFRHNNPFLSINDDDEAGPSDNEQQPQQQKANDPHQLQSVRPTFQRKIILIDIITFDLFSAFSMNPNFGDITNIRTSLVAFCQLTNHMSSQFSSKIIQIGPTGRYEQLLSFSDVVDYRVSVADSCKQKFNPSKQTTTGDKAQKEKKYSSQRCSSIRGFLTRSGSLSCNNNGDSVGANGQFAGRSDEGQPGGPEGGGTLAKYYRSLVKSHSTVSDRSNSLMARLRKQESTIDESDCSERTKQIDSQSDSMDKKKLANTVRDNTLHSMINSGLGDFSGLSETNYIPVNMAFIFRNGKIALFEFTESYAIHTREAQLDRYDYSKVIDVTKDGNVFIVTILTIFDKLIKVVI